MRALGFDNFGVETQRAGPRRRAMRIRKRPRHVKPAVSVWLASVWVENAPDARIAAKHSDPQTRAERAVSSLAKQFMYRFVQAIAAIAR